MKLKKWNKIIFTSLTAAISLSVIPVAISSTNLQPIQTQKINNYRSINSTSQTIDGVTYDLIIKDNPQTSQQTKYWAVSKITANKKTRIEIKSELSFNNEIFPVKTLSNLTIFSNTLEELIIPSTIEAVYNNFILCCPKMKSFTFPNSIKYFESSILTFIFCSQLQKVQFPSKLSEYAYLSPRFIYCPELTTINLPINISTIPENFIINCNKLKTFVVPPNVKNISFSAFGQMFNYYSSIFNFLFSNVETIYVPTTANFCYSSFTSRNKAKVLFYDPATYTYNFENPMTPTPINSDNHSNLRIKHFNYIYDGIYKGKLKLPENLELNEMDFSYTPQLKELELNSSTTTTEAIAGSSIIKLIIPSTVETLTQSLSMSLDLQEVVINEGVKNIHANIFNETPSLHSLKIPASVQNIYNRYHQFNPRLNELIFAKGSPLVSLINSNQKPSWFPPQLTEQTTLENGDIKFFNPQAPEFLLSQTQEKIYDIDLKHYPNVVKNKFKKFIQSQPRFKNDIKDNLESFELIYSDLEKSYWRYGTILSPNNQPENFSRYYHITNPIISFQPYQLSPTIFNNQQIIDSQTQAINQNLIKQILKDEILKSVDLPSTITKNIKQLNFETRIDNQNLLINNIHIPITSEKIKVCNDFTIPLTTGPIPQPPTPSPQPDPLPQPEPEPQPNPEIAEPSKKMSDLTFYLLVGSGIVILILLIIIIALAVKYKKAKKELLI